MQATVTNAITLLGSLYLFQTDQPVLAVLLMIGGGLLGLYYEERGK